MEIKDKIEVFFHAAIDAANEQSKEILEDYKNVYQEGLLEYEKNKQDGQQTRTRIAEAAVRKEVNRTVSEQVLQLKKEYHIRQEERKEELFALVEEKIAAYRKTSEYKSCLTEKIHAAKKLAGDEALTVYLDPADQALQKELEQQTACVLTVSKETFGGGIRAVVRSRNILMDESFDRKLEEEKEQFSF